ncbi:MAG TPA: zf-HC2 domain-containing protein [Terriglobales bacterium]|nr:zf-HC2 domain-containing protein [Terriglobales bacterium]
MDRLGNILKQRLMAQQSPDSDHPAADMLVAFAERVLRAPEHERVLSHLAVCPACRQAVALAASEPGEFQPLTSSVPSRWAIRLPSAIRWVSAAAALAVAAGVGALFYQHQEKPLLLSANRVEKTQNTEPSAPPANTAPQASDREITDAFEKTRSKSGGGAIAGPKRDGVGEHMENKKAAKAVVGGLVGSSHAKAETVPTQMANAFTTGNTANAQSRGDWAFETKPGAPLNPPPPPQVQSRVAPPAAPQMFPQAYTARETAELRRAESDTKSGASGPTVHSSQPGVGAAAKPVASFAIAGPPKAHTAYVGSLAYWTISSSGKLQRLSQNGGSTAVEPAPGVTVRAVAAQGIEVWAGGSQLDLSATQSQPRPVLFHSSDAGETWTKIEGPWQGPIQSLVLPDLHSLTVVTSDGRWATADAGKSWARK